MQTSVTTDRPELSTEKAAGYCSCKPSTFKTFRSRQQGPAFYKIGRRVLYKQSDLDIWMESRRVDPKDQPREAKVPGHGPTRRGA